MAVPPPLPPLPEEDNGRIAFEQFAEGMRQALQPVGAFEVFIAEQVIRSAYRLKCLYDWANPAYIGGDRSFDRLAATHQRSYQYFMKLLETARKRRERAEKAAGGSRTAAGSSKSSSRSKSGSQSGQGPKATKNTFEDEVDATMKEIDAPYEGMSAILTEPSAGAAAGPVEPMVRDTGYSVSHFLRLINDGWGCRRIMRAHHGEIALNDLRACIEYALSRNNPDIIAFVKQPHEDWAPLVAAWGLAERA